MDMQDFVKRVEWMNETFETGSNDAPTNLKGKRILAFHKIIVEECHELVAAVPRFSNQNLNEDDDADLVTVADTLGDIVVYCFSEARRWGIPLMKVLEAIMDSQASKLVQVQCTYCTRGQPVIRSQPVCSRCLGTGWMMVPLWNADHSKFEKGPNYVKPEPRIAEILRLEGIYNAPANMRPKATLRDSDYIVTNAPNIDVVIPTFEGQLVPELTANQDGSMAKATGAFIKASTQKSEIVAARTLCPQCHNPLNKHILAKARQYTEPHTNEEVAKCGDCQSQVNGRV